MAIEYGDQEVIRFMYDKLARKIVVQLKQEILEDGVLKDYIFPQVHARTDDFDDLLERLMPSVSGAKEHIEAEGAKIVRENWAVEKQKRAKAKTDKGGG